MPRTRLNPRSPRQQLLEALAAAINSGDSGAARIAHRALGELLGPRDDADPEAIADLASERRKRCES